MALSLVNLDEATRRFMAQEISRDLYLGALYISPRLSVVGQRDWPELLQSAARHHDDVWLANHLSLGNRLNEREPRRMLSGEMTTAKVPVTANETLAEGEFNRFYARGLCLRAIANGAARLEVYRAKAVAIPRTDSPAMIGAAINPRALLDDLRTHPGIDTALGLPPGPNSGLSVKLPQSKDAGAARLSASAL
ncbi:MAG TPA: hypothetical protein VEI03_16610 [Stellaceae bacterium]|nr:hypothetical protein [Stellaceae bacterium]